jgi:hypothetical protein
MTEPLAVLFGDVASGRYPSQDDSVTVLPSHPQGCRRFRVHCSHGDLHERGARLAASRATGRRLVRAARPGFLLSALCERTSGRPFIPLRHDCECR